MDSVRAHMAAKLKEFRKNSGMNVDQVGEHLGKSGKTISAWEVGRGQPDADELIELCKLYKVLISDFFLPKYEYAVVKFDDDSACEEFADVPVYGSIAAGTPIEMIPVDEFHQIPAAMHARYPHAFLLRVQGESMNRVLPNGCYALIDPREEVAKDNDPYAVCVNGYDATIKRVKKLANGFQLVPDSTDPTYPVQTFNYNEPGTDEITVIGKVVWHVIPFDWTY